MSRNQVNPFSTLSTPSNNSTSLQLSSPYLTHPVPIPLYAGEPGALLATLSARHAFYTQRTRASQAVAGAQLRAAIDARRASAVAAAAAGPEGSGAQSSKRKRARQSTAATAAAPDNENVDEDENEECPVEKRLRTALEQTATRAPAQPLPLSSTTTTPTALHHQAFLAAAPAAPFQHPYPQANAAGMGSSTNNAAPSTGGTSQGPSSRSRTTAGRTSSRTGSNSNNRHTARAPLPPKNGFLLAGVLPPAFNTTTAAPLHAPSPSAAVPQFTPLMAARMIPATATAAPPVLPSVPRAPLYVDLTTASDNDDGEERGYDNTGLGLVNYNAWAPANTTTAAVGAAVQTQAQLPAPPAAGPQKTAVDPQEVANMLQWRRQPPEWSQPSHTGFLNKEAYKKMTRTPWKPVKRGAAAEAAAPAAVSQRPVMEKTIRKETSRSRTTTNTRAAGTVARPQGVVKKTAPAPVPAQTTKPSSGKSQAILEKEKALQNALEDLEREKEKEMAERRHQPNQLAAAETGAVNDSPTHATTTTAITRSAPQNPALLLDEGYGSNNTSPAKDPEHPETQELPESLRNCGLLLPGMRRGPPAPKPKEKQKAAEKEAEKKVEPQRADQDNSAELVGPDRTSEQPTPNPDEIEDGANDNQDNDLDELLEITTDDLDELFGDADGNNDQEKEAEHSDIAEADVIESRDRCQDFLEQLWPSRNLSYDLLRTATEGENVEASDPSQSQEKDSSLFSLFGDSEDDEHDESDDESEQQEGQTRRELANAQVEQQRKKANDQRREAEDLERARETAARKLAKEQEKLRQDQLLQQQRDEEANDLLAMLEHEMMRDPEAEARAEQQRIEDEARAAQKRIEDEWSEEE